VETEQEKCTHSLVYIMRAVRPSAYVIANGMRGDMMMKNASSPLPKSGYFARGYSRTGDSQRSCMSTARYHVWFKHCNTWK